MNERTIYHVAEFKNGRMVRDTYKGTNKTLAETYQRMWGGSITTFKERVLSRSDRKAYRAEIVRHYD